MVNLTEIYIYAVKVQKSGNNSSRGTTLGLASKLELNSFYRIGSIGSIGFKFVSQGNLIKK